jgi:hypothetical protein
MVKLPAIGQRSIRATRMETLLEVILKSGNFEPAGLPGAPNYGWLGSTSTRRQRRIGTLLPMNSGESVQEAGK